MMRKVLIACPDDGISYILCRYLSNCEVYTCDTGEEALCQIDQLQPDIALIFLSLPKLDGLTVLRRASFRPPVIIALSAFVTNDLLHTAADLGIMEIVLIPFSLQYLFGIINKYM